MRIITARKAIAILMSFIFILSVHAQEREVKKEIVVGIIIDGPHPRLWELDQLVAKELGDLTRGEFNVVFPQSKRVVADWTVAGIHQAIEQLLNDQDVDIVLTLGGLSSVIAARIDNLNKPVVAPVVVDPKIQNIPNKNGTSGIKNYNYISSFSSSDRDIGVFFDIVKFSNLTILADKSIIESIPELDHKLAEMTETFGMEITLITETASAADFLDRIPDDAEAVYVTPLTRLDDEEMKKLIQGLIERKLPSFSMEGRIDVEKGILLGVAPIADLSRLARRVAINVQRILLGEDAGDLPVAFSQGENLALNMATARAIGFDPTWDVLIEADLINEEPEQIERKYSLKGVMQQAITVNLDVKSAERAADATRHDISLARSNLLPQLDASATSLVIDEDRALSSLGAQPEGSLRAGLSLTQILYSEEALANLDIQKKLRLLKEYELEKAKLNIALEAAISYLNVLKAKTNLSIQKENLKVTRSNLELARVRESIGISGRSDVYRWESLLATSKNRVITAQAELFQAEVQLNRVLNRPLEEPFLTEEVSLADSALIFREKELSKFTSSPQAFTKFRNYLVPLGVLNNPDLLALDTAIEVKERQLKSARAVRWSPTLAVKAAIENRLTEWGEGSDPPNLDVFFNLPEPLDFTFPQANRTDYSFAIVFSIPVLKGGAISAQERKILEELNELKFQRESLWEKISQQIRASVRVAGAKYQSIALTAKAAEAASKNLDLVTDGYSRGVVNIIELLDAQNAAVVADELAANAIYDFAISELQMERANGKFFVFMSDEQMQEWLKMLNFYFNEVVPGTSGGINK